MNEVWGEEVRTKSSSRVASECFSRKINSARSRITLRTFESLISSEKTRYYYILYMKT